MTQPFRPRVSEEFPPLDPRVRPNVRTVTLHRPRTPPKDRLIRALKEKGVPYVDRVMILHTIDHLTPESREWFLRPYVRNWKHLEKLSRI